MNGKIINRLGKTFSQVVANMAEESFALAQQELEKTDDSHLVKIKMEATIGKDEFGQVGVFDPKAATEFKTGGKIAFEDAAFDPQQPELFEGQDQ